MSKTLVKSHYLLPSLVYNLLTDLQHYYNENQHFSDELLINLHSLLGSVLFDAMDLLQSARFTEYTTQKNHKKLFKIFQRHDSHFLFNNINYCSCDTFDEVASFNLITCEHVLSIKLAEIKGVIYKEILTDGQLIDLLNSQIEFQ